MKTSDGMRAGDLCARRSEGEDLIVGERYRPATSANLARTTLLRLVLRLRVSASGSRPRIGNAGDEGQGIHRTSNFVSANCSSRAATHLVPYCNDVAKPGRCCFAVSTITEGDQSSARLQNEDFVLFIEFRKIINFFP